MTNKPLYVQYCFPQLTAKQLMLNVSEDGYIRLTFKELQGVRLTHLISGLDNQWVNPAAEGAFFSAITGYTEWVSDSLPRITTGWDWEMHFSQGQIQLHRTSEPYTNIMLQDSKGTDLGSYRSILLQGNFVDCLDWQVIVQDQINVRYR